MPFHYRTCDYCDHKRICRQADDDAPWVCEVCDEEGDVSDWPASLNEGDK